MTRQEQHVRRLKHRCNAYLRLAACPPPLQTMLDIQVRLLLAAVWDMIRDVGVAPDIHETPYQPDRYGNEEAE
jgi:hypothetical protein